jgi:hypothetical protein
MCSDEQRGMHVQPPPHSAELQLLPAQLTPHVSQLVQQCAWQVLLWLTSACCFFYLQRGQLGVGDTMNRCAPTVVPGLAGKKVVGGEQRCSQAAAMCRSACCSIAGGLSSINAA